MMIKKIIEKITDVRLNEEISVHAGVIDFWIGDVEYHVNFNIRKNRIMPHLVFILLKQGNVHFVKMNARIQTVYV